MAHINSDILRLGVDVGSTTVKAVALDPADNSVLFTRYQRHNAHQADTVRQLLEEYREKGTGLVAIDAISLLESPLSQLCHATIAVIAPPEVRVRRIMAREGISEDYAWSRVKAQKRDNYFIQGCDYTLNNDCAGPEEFALQARTLLESILHKHIQ